MVEDVGASDDVDVVVWAGAAELVVVLITTVTVLVVDVVELPPARLLGLAALEVEVVSAELVVEVESVVDVVVAIIVVVVVVVVDCAGGTSLAGRASR